MLLVLISVRGWVDPSQSGVAFLWATFLLRVQKMSVSYLGPPTVRSVLYFFLIHSRQVVVLNQIASFLIPTDSLFSNRSDIRPYSFICRHPREYIINKCLNWAYCRLSPGRGAAAMPGGLVSTGWRKTDWQIFVCRVSHGPGGRPDLTANHSTESETLLFGLKLWPDFKCRRYELRTFWELFNTKCWKGREPPWWHYPSVKSNK
jgi:hypothetical protein